MLRAIGFEDGTIENQKKGKKQQSTTVAPNSVREASQPKGLQY